jgi:hypothetical protein
MTTAPADVCTGGSEPQPGFSVAIALGPAALGKLLPRGSAWVESFLFAFGVALNFSGSIFCVSGPAADPEITGPELAAGLEQLANGEVPAVLEKLVQFCERFVWYAFCQCDDGQAPIPVADIPAPPGVPIIDPTPPVTVPLTQPCLSVPMTVQIATGDTNFTSSASFPGVAATAVQVTFGAPELTGVSLGGSMDYEFGTIDSAGFHQLGHTLVTVPASGVVPVTPMTVPPGSNYLRVFATGNGVPPPKVYVTWNSVTDFYCGTTPGQPLGLNCCPPDPEIIGALNQILQLIRGIQTSSGPTSWVDGAVHGTLSGAGSFPLLGAAIGIRVDMVTLPAGTRVGPGEPTFFWDAGFVTPIALTSPLRGQRLVFEHESMTLPAFTDSVGYTLINGCTVTITELLPVNS